MSMTIKRAIKILDNAKHLFHFSCAEIDQNIAMDMAIAALREKAAREEPRPLTLEELEKMTGEPVYVVSQKRSRWYIVHSFHMENVVGRCFILTNVSSAKEHFPRSEYGITWKAYRHKPKEV